MSNTNYTISVNITFKNTQATDPIKQYADEKVRNCLQKFVHHDTEAHVVLNVEKNRQIAEISFRSDGADFHCKEESGDLYSSIDMLTDSLSKQLRKHKDRITSHH